MHRVRVDEKRRWSLPKSGAPLVTGDELAVGGPRAWPAARAVGGAIPREDYHIGAGLVGLDAVNFTSCSQSPPAGMALASTGEQGWMKLKVEFTPEL